MPDIEPDELRRMAAAIDADLEPRVRVELDLSAEGAQRVRDILRTVASDAMLNAGIETAWPIYRVLAALETAS